MCLLLTRRGAMGVILWLGERERILWHDVYADRDRILTTGHGLFVVSAVSAGNIGQRGLFAL